jgi:hypothetical protein
MLSAVKSLILTFILNLFIKKHYSHYHFLKINIVLGENWSVIILRHNYRLKHKHPVLLLPKHGKIQAAKIRIVRHTW